MYLYGNYTFRSQGRELGAGRVIIYSIEGCPACVMAKEYFKKRGVAFTVRDGSDMGEVPVIEVDGRRMVGFSERALDAALAKRVLA